jgi:hypothetical protein
MIDRRLRNEARAQEICRAGFEKLSTDDGSLRARALALVDLWERKATCGPYYPRRWRELLAMPLDQARTIVLADTDEGQSLRAASPFAGFFSNEERRRFRNPSR